MKSKYPDESYLKQIEARENVLFPPDFRQSVAATSPNRLLIESSFPDGVFICDLKSYAYWSGELGQFKTRYIPFFVDPGDRTQRNREGIFAFDRQGGSSSAVVILSLPYIDRVMVYPTLESFWKALDQLNS